MSRRCKRTLPEASSATAARKGRFTKVDHLIEIKTSSPPSPPEKRYNAMLSELDLLLDVSRRLEEAGFEYMLTGSMALNHYAQPRMTHDT